MRAVVPITLWLAFVPLISSASGLSERQQLALKQMDLAATANLMAAFLPAARKTLSQRLSDYAHTRFRNVTMSVVTPLDHLGHGFLVCGEILITSQDVQYRIGDPARGWQPFVIDKGLVHEIDYPHVTFGNQGAESSKFVQDMCVQNMMNARPWRDCDPEFFTNQISPH